MTRDCKSLAVSLRRFESYLQHHSLDPRRFADGFSSHFFHRPPQFGGNLGLTISPMLGSIELWNLNGNVTIVLPLHGIISCAVLA